MTMAQKHPSELTLLKMRIKNWFNRKLFPIKQLQCKLNGTYIGTPK